MKAWLWVVPFVALIVGGIGGEIDGYRRGRAPYDALLDRAGERDGDDLVRRLESAETGLAASKAASAELQRSLEEADARARAAEQRGADLERRLAGLKDLAGAGAAASEGTLGAVEAVDDRARRIQEAVERAGFGDLRIDLGP